MVIGGLLVGLIVAVVFVMGAQEKRQKLRRAAIHEARGALVTRWSAFYDVAGRRIGLRGVPMDQLFRYLIFRVQDLLNVHVGLQAARKRIAQKVCEASASPESETWQLLLDIADSEVRPQGSMPKYFEGELFEHGLSCQRYIGGSADKSEGEIGECVAIAQALSRDPSLREKVQGALHELCRREFAEGGVGGMDQASWGRANAVLDAVSGR